MPFDTTPEAAAVQREILGRLSPAERLRIAFDLSDAVRNLAVAGLRKRNPGLTEEELARALIELCYGKAAQTRTPR